MTAARSFYLAFALGRRCNAREAVQFADYAMRVPRLGVYLTAEDLYDDWANLQHVARVEFELYGTNLIGAAS